MEKIEGASRFNNPFIPLKHANFRYYFFGMIISQTGSWMQNIAQPWLAYRLTESPLMLSLVSALQFLPLLFFSLFAGVYVDRFPKRKILMITQMSFLLITMALAILTLTGKIQYWHLLITSTLMGLTNTLDMPGRQSFVIELVGKDDLMNAIALNSAVFNVARIFGPALAGIIMASFGPGFCFLGNSISYAAVLISLFFIKPLHIPKAPPKNAKVIANIKDGLKHIYNNKILMTTVIIMSVVNLLGMNYNVLVPVFTIQVLHMSEITYGLMMSFMGFGSLGGALLTASISRTGPKRFMLYIVPFINAGVLILVGFLRNFYIILPILTINSFFNMMLMASANSSMQLNTTNEYRGRVMSVYTLVFAGAAPFGNVFAGAISTRFDAAVGFIACGVALLVVMIPIYAILGKKVGKV
jgi:MFS family permease